MMMWLYYSVMEMMHTHLNVHFYSLYEFYICHAVLVGENAEDSQSCRNRLATLAENIRAWEEDCSHPQIKSVSQHNNAISLSTMSILLIIASSQIV